MTELRRSTESALHLAGIEASPEAVDRLVLFMELVSAYGKNRLVSRRKPGDILNDHVSDSLRLLAFAPEAFIGRYLDIGSGGGFPGLVIKALRPQLETVLLDSRLKRADFLEFAVRELGLDGALVIQARAEEYAVRSGPAFDAVTARAVAKPEAALRLAAPFLRPGGVFLHQAGEQEEAARGRLVALAKSLGVLVVKVDSYASPQGVPLLTTCYRKH